MQLNITKKLKPSIFSKLLFLKKKLIRKVFINIIIYCKESINEFNLVKYYKEAKPSIFSKLLFLKKKIN